jgi:hypothetical protein
MAVTQTTQAGQRRLVYGLNVALQIVLLIVAVIGVIWISQQYRRQIDVTRTGVNSLSPRTKQLLRGLDQDVRITAVYTVLSEYDKAAQKRQDAVQDLLKLYESAGRGKVTGYLVDPMKSSAPVKTLLQRLKDKPAYKDQAVEHQAVLEAFPELSTRITDLINARIAEAEQLMQLEPNLQSTVLAEVVQELQRLLDRTDVANRDIRDLQAREIPRYGDAVERARSHLEVVSSYFKAVQDWVRNKAATTQGLSQAALDLLNRSSDAFATLLGDIDALAEQARGLERVELETLSNQLNRWDTAPPIIVETDQKAELLPFSEVWPFPPGAMPRPTADDRQFKGEQAISSAILKLTQTEKTAVVFVRYGGESPIIPDFSRMQMMNMRQLPRAPFGLLNDLLEKQNFVTEDWDVKTQKTPPEVEDAARTVYVILPPEPPQQQDPRRPPPEPGMSPEDVQIVTDAVEQAGMAIFLATWRPSMSPMPGAPGGAYEYADYLKSTWGVDVLHDYLVLPFAPSREDPKLFVPTRQTQRALIDNALRMTDQEIAAPLQAAPAGFEAVCPLKLDREQTPEGVDVEPVVLVEETDDVWAMSDLSHLNEDFRRQRGTRPRPEDLRAPFPVAAAATHEGKDQRVVVFGSATFAANNLLEMGGLVLGGGGLQTYTAYPANSDLFINSLHWLTRDAERISVGAQRTDVPRLDALKDDAWLQFWKVFLVGIWPATALIIGGGVWLIRRR